LRVTSRRTGSGWSESPFLGQPVVEDLEDLVVGGGGADCPTGEQVGHEHLEVGPGGGRQAGPRPRRKVSACRTAM
jgi:hypothetical protein